jgi:endoglucanase
MRLIASAREIIEATGCPVYVDCGHARWLAPDVAAELLDAVGARRFALNVSNYVELNESVAYGERIVLSLGPTSSFVIDVGRCGNGAAPDNEWCNPRGRALGPSPTTLSGTGSCDALLWVKPPGESDGESGGGAPPAGVYWPELALELARNLLHE